MSSFETQYWFGPIGKPEDGKLMEHVVWHINDVTLDAFKDLRSAKKYDVNDVTKLLDWFNKAQKLWGIYEIVRRAIIRYSEQIIAKYDLE
ncbi:hypothetical protein H6F74_01820 [Trichocoleus sp. FACHB-90]|uniref:hypothetical protein n=1 Tax=Cyanophyceae TaxID=3028117 RepID=UPI001684ED02|nr:hypothetical protein [Trichocoleus sp. FACHB-90]MBD1925026.1 hypothetical protein [Trichocoleus sp. FACHB-90]